MLKAQHQRGHSLLSLLLGLVLSLALLLVWQRLLVRVHLSAGSQQQQARGWAQLAWLQAQLQQDFAAQPQGPCVVPEAQAIRVDSAQALTLTPRLWVAPVVASRGFGPASGHTLTAVTVVASSPLQAYLADASDYVWTLSRCDVAWSFTPRAWRTDGRDVSIELPGGWALGVHEAGQPRLLSLSVSERVRYEGTAAAGVVRRRLPAPAAADQATPARQLNRFEVRAWQRLGCDAIVPSRVFQAPDQVAAGLMFYEVIMGWQASAARPAFSLALTLVPTQAEGC
ncbi:MAG: hypothetical protein KA498_03600 [Neisseriaceae bacterium]|nr:hypothetical protein [Neisseriaceae bacterium]